MKQTRSNIIIASTLALLFTVFNIGLPIAMYVCPMMSGDLSTCTCNCTHEGLSISYHMDDCCSSKVLAERNTTPFLDVAKFRAPGAELVFVFSFAATNPQAPSFAHTSIAAFDTSPITPAIPLYLQSSSLLI